MKRNLLRMLAVLAICLLVLPAGTGAEAFRAQAGSAKDRYEELEKELSELNNKIDALENKADAAADQKKTLQQQISVLKEQIALLGQQVTDQQAAVVAKQQELDAKKFEIATSDELLRERLRTLYMVRNDGVLSTVLGANTYSEALTAADTLQRIAQADTQLLEQLSTQKKELEEEEAKQEELLTQLQATQTEMADKQNSLAGSLQQVDNTLSTLDAQQSAAQEEYDRIYKEYEAAKAEADKEFVESGNITEYVGGTFCWPTPGYSTISSPFGWRTLYGQQDYHTGIDITGTYSGQIYGAPVVAANDGYVTVARYGTTGYGICVYVDHGGGYISRYGHCSSLAVAPGDYVTKGQVIAYAGNSGNSTGPHLHFEIRQDGVAVNPMQFFTQS